MKFLFQYFVVKSTFDNPLFRLIFWCFAIQMLSLYLCTDVFAVDLPSGYEADVDQGVETLDKASGVFRTVLNGTIAILLVASAVFAILLRAIPNREWKEKGKAILYDNLGTILLVLIGLPVFLSILKFIKV